MNPEVDVVTFDVERGKVREFALATFAEDQIHTDPEVGRARGFGDVVATATYVAVSLHYRDQKSWVAGLGLDIERTIVGSVGWTYHRPMVVGDSIVGRRRVTDEVTKPSRAGDLRVLTLVTDFTDEVGELVATEKAVVIERPAQ